MTWLSAQELKNKIAQLPEAESELMFRAFALSEFVSAAFYLPEFEPEEEWAEAITPSPAGARLLEDLHKIGFR